ncbi:MAG: class I mannose-6-phosphate isomerase [Dysgonomonas sp.]
MRKPNYDKYPATKIAGAVLVGWNEIIKSLGKTLKSCPVMAIDMYVGVYEDDVISQVSILQPELFFNTRDLFKSEEEIRKMTGRFMTDDVLFGYITNLSILDYFDPEKLEDARNKITKHGGSAIVVGCGASLVVPSSACVIYVDMARWEIQQRFRAHSISALGIDDRNEPISIQHKRGYFNDWRICDMHKHTLYHRVSYWLDTHDRGKPKMIDKETFFKGIEATVTKPFRVVPFFDPAPWGGQWMKDTFGLDNDNINYGWCFDCVPEENSLYLNIDGILFEMPALNLVLLKSLDLLGEPVESRFGKEFPIRFDFLDTVQGGSLSLQVHPTTQFVHDSFGIHYTQDESYYMMDAKDDAVVYLGLKTGISKDEMISDLEKAQKGELVFDAEKYTNKIPAKKHDHFLIPNGTVHCSGPQGVVLEISSTPNLFTFKLWDWERLGLDGKPRPINVERGKKVINWSRDTEYTYKNLVNVCSVISEGDGWIEEKTGLHPNEFIETRRFRFSKKTWHKTNSSVNVLNLVEGEEVIVEDPKGKFEPFVVHYAETFIIPAALSEYTITPTGESADKECMVIKAYVRF